MKWLKVIFLINVKCIIKGTLDRYSFNVKLYDLNDKLIFEGKTDIYGNLSINNLKCGIYTIEVVSIHGIKPRLYRSKIYHNGNLDLKLYFDEFKTETKLPIILNLYDKYYNGLKIKTRGGKIILWKPYTINIADGMPPESTFTLTDANYEDLPTESWTITFE